MSGLEVIGGFNYGENNDPPAGVTVPNITIPDRTKIRLCTDFSHPQNGQALPAILATVGTNNPGPIVIDPSTALSAAGQTHGLQGGGVNGTAGYIGYNPDSNIGAGQPISPVRGVLVEGYANVLPGVDVYLDPAHGADDTATSSGVTQTPSQSIFQLAADRQISPGTQSATASFDIEVPAGVTTLAGLDIATTGAVASDAANYWTFSAVNTGANGAGNAALLAATAANTTQAAGGFSLAANVPQALALSATPANLAVVPGQIITVTLTKAAAAPNLAGLVIHASFTGNVAQDPRRIGTGWSATKIYFF